MASIGIEQKLQGLLKNMEEVYFVTLLGSYNIWQEVSEVRLISYLLLEYTYRYLYTIMLTGLIYNILNSHILTWVLFIC